MKHLVKSVVSIALAKANALDIRHKLGLVVVISILVTAIPSSILAYHFAAKRIIQNELDNLSYSLNSETTNVDEYFVESKNRLQNTARLIQDEMQAPFSNQEATEFDAEVELNKDGVWRNRLSGFNGANEAGIYLPAGEHLPPDIKKFHARVKRVLDYVGPVTNKVKGNIWVLSSYRSEVIYDATFPNFVFDQEADNNYLETPWILETTPDKNPTREFRLTPPLFDPVPKTWMVSSLVPLYIHDQWVGSLGQDLLLSNVLAFMQSGADVYPGTQHFLVDSHDNLILAGSRQRELESRTNSGTFNLSNFPDLYQVFKKIDQFKDHVDPSVIRLDGRSYVGIGHQFNSIGWRHYILVPKDEILAPTRQLFYTIVIIILIGSVVGGFLIAFSVNSTVVKRIRQLADAIKLYETGDSERVYLPLHGSDEISVAAREFEVMQDRINSYVDEVKIARDQLAQSETRWRFALEGASDGVWEYDCEKQKCHLSHQMMAIIGLDPQSDNNVLTLDEMKSRIHPDSLEPSLSSFFDLVEGKVNRYFVEHQVLHNNGEYIWLLSRGMAVNFTPDGKPMTLIGTSSDITERKNTEYALKNAHAKYQHLVENIASEYMFYTIDKYGYFSYVSASITTMMGWLPEEYLHKHYAHTLTSHTVSQESIKYTAAGLLGHKQPPYLIEEYCKDGTKLWLELYETPIYDADGNLNGLDGIAHNITKRIIIEEQLKEAHSKYQHLVENISNEYYFYTHDVNGIFTYVSSSMTKMLGWSTEEFKVHHTKFLTDNPINQKCLVLTEAGLRGQKQPSYQVERKHKDGTTRWLELNETPVFDDAGNVIGLEGIAHDVTDKKKADANLLLAASVFMHAKEGIMITDAMGYIIEVNDTLSAISGFSRDEVIGKKFNIFQSKAQVASSFTAMWKELSEKGYWHGEQWNTHKNGDEYAVSMTVSCVLDESGNAQSYVALFTDITMMKHHQQQLEHIAHFDVLTSLPNRVLLADRLSQAMLHCQRSGQYVAVAFLDLDGFKSVNDRYGHEIGDELLINVSQRMKSCLREGDTLARIGGDEFVAVLVGLESIQDCEPLLTRLLSVASSSVVIHNKPLQVSASIGVTLYPQDGGDADQLLRHADQAMYLAKQAGKNRYHLFDIAQDIAVKTQRESIEHISRALENNEFVLYYQPKVNMRNGDIVGLEALIRWLHPERGLLPPAVFLPVIENHALSVKLGEWVLDTAMSQMEAWVNAGMALRVSVNISALQLQSDSFVERLQRILDRHHAIDPQSLELEILETSALEDISKVSELMQACRALGVRFSIDDFGTGYSSLTYLKRLPADYLKIDQSFVRDMIEDPDDFAIVKGVIGLADAFHRDVIAEGVETIQHGTLLLSLGCTLAQGYGIARPMPASDIHQWIVNWKPNQAWQDVVYPLKINHL